jgi:transcriptional regulator with GAF, ATPase, and Fis domain
VALLHAIGGPLEGAIFRLPAEDVSVGRMAFNQLCVGDPSVSRQHCLIQREKDGFRIRDSGSNNGTFVNGNRIEECILADGDKIRIGDTLFRFRLKEGTSAEEQLNLPDNGVVANTALEQEIWGSATTAVKRLFETVGRDGAGAARAMALLKIGAGLNTSQEPEALQIDVLRQILEVVPAERAAIVLLAQGAGGEPAVTGWDRRRRQAAPVPVSRTLVARAIRESLATFSDDVTSHEELSEVTSLTRRRVVSVITVPLVAEQRTIGAIYMDSANPLDRLNREHLEIATAIGEFAGSSLERAVRLSALREENRRLQSALQLKHNLIGCSPAMRNITERIARIVGTDATVIIRGETGTGKELAARAIHQNSARAGRPFEAMNCSLLRDTLLESELFGHEKGSFTGAIAQKKGKLELADGGTVFLDELGELGEPQQAMLLRVLQTREFQRVGGSRTIRVDIRIIAATNRNLEESIQNKTFREDLYYRLNVVSVTMPPLRERLEDIRLLADHFVQLYSRKNKRLVRSISGEAIALMLQYGWPGNVRELENAIEYAVVFGSTEEILPEDLPETVIGSAVSPDHGYHHSVRDAKRKIIRSAVEQAMGNYGEAARRLGIHVNNLHRLIRELELKPVIGAARASAGNASSNRC